MERDEQIMTFLKDVVLTVSTPANLRERAFDLYVERRIKGRETIDKTPSGMVKSLASWQFDSVQNEIRAGCKIQAIKNLRAYTNMGLKEAKDCVEDGSLFKQLV